MRRVRLFAVLHLYMGLFSLLSGKRDKLIDCEIMADKTLIKCRKPCGQGQCLKLTNIFVVRAPLRKTEEGEATG